MLDHGLQVALLSSGRVYAGNKKPTRDPRLSIITRSATGILKQMLCHPWPLTTKEL